MEPRSTLAVYSRLIELFRSPPAQPYRRGSCQRRGPSELLRSTRQETRTCDSYSLAESTGFFPAGAATTCDRYLQLKLFQSSVQEPESRRTHAHHSSLSSNSCHSRDSCRKTFDMTLPSKPLSVGVLSSHCCHYEHALAHHSPPARDNRPPHHNIHSPISVQQRVKSLINAEVLGAY